MFGGQWNVLELSLLGSLKDALNVSPEMGQQTLSDFDLLCLVSYYYQ